MTTESTMSVREQPKQKVVLRQGGASGAVYGLGLIGALVYYISHASTFLLGILGILKAIVWPAMLVYEALRFLNM